MSGCAPLVLSCNVSTVDDLHDVYSLNLDAPKPKLPPSRPLSIVRMRTFGVYGADEALKALQLETRVADAPALSHLTVREESGYMTIHAVDANLIVLDWGFPACGTLSQVYLVYDAVEQSITMISSRPWSRTTSEEGEKCDSAAAISVLIARNGRRGSYALVKMAETRTYYGKSYKTVKKQDALYVWKSSSGSWQWDLVRAKFPALFKGDNVARSYATVLAFTCGRYAFWANLFRGIMYCRVDAMLSATNLDDDHELKLDFIELPVDHPDVPPCPISCAIELRSDMYRTIGRSGESSVKFVIIDGFVELFDFGSCTLKVWSFSPEEDMGNWTKRFLHLSDLIKQKQFKMAHLPTDMVPMYPSLSAEEDDIVYFMLGEYKKCCRAHKGSKTRCNGYIPIAKNPQYHLRVDMSRGVLLAAARLPHPTSPSLGIASTSVVPSPMIQRGSTSRIGTKKIDRKDGNQKKGGRFASSQ